MSRFSYLFFAAFFSAAPLFAETDDDVLLEALWPAVSSAPEGVRPRTGIALAGGGARAFSHTGVLQVIHDSGFPIDMVSGTSMGSVIGAYYSAGRNFDELWKFGSEAKDMQLGKDFKGIQLLSLLLNDRFMKPVRITDFISRTFGDMYFEQLQKPFACTAVDILSGERLVFSTGRLAWAVRASVNIPGLFEPVEYMHRYLVDGGVTDNLPVDVVKHMGAEYIIASLAENNVAEVPTNVLTVLMRIIDIRGGIIAAEAKKQADFVVSPSVNGIGTADFSRCTEAGEAGLVAMNAKIKALKQSYAEAALPEIFAR